MKSNKLIAGALLFTGLAVCAFFRFEVGKTADVRQASGFSREENGREKEDEGENEAKTENIRARMQYEFDMLKDPATGKLPDRIFEKERAFALTLPERPASDGQKPMALNSYIPAGPNNIGGRTRAVEYDVRFNGTTNNVIIAGSVSGGIMRSADGGNNWTLVTPQNDVHAFTALAQDPRPGSQDTWYAAGGEFVGNSAREIGDAYLGFGIWKSTDNGFSWTKQTLLITDINGSILGAGTLEAFDNTFDIVHRLQVNPVNGDLYIAGHRRLVRSTNGGASFNVVFGTSAGASSATGQMDVAISNTGRVLLTVNGGSPDVASRGVWISSSGNAGSFTRIAGGQTLGVDSVAGWRANAYNGASKRILVSLAPSNNNIAYVYYENGLSSDAPQLQPEADFFRLDIAGTAYTWQNRSSNMPDFFGSNLTGSDPLSVQGGYDMVVKVLPTNPDIVFIGGTNLYRSNDGFATSNNTAWINGYQTNFTYGQYPNGHSDIHALVFNPSNPNTAICGNDGGIQQTTAVTANTVSWNVISRYQTLQCYNVAIDPGAGRNNFASGAQDNGVRFRDKTGVLGTPPTDSNNHRLLFSADGAYVGISRDNAGVQYLYESIQLGRLFRVRLLASSQNTVEITPPGLTISSPGGSSNEFGEFVTNLRLEADNSDNLFYVNFNRLFRTTSASTASTTTGWTELTGVSSAINPNNPTSGRDIAIRGIGFSRGTYNPGHSLYLGTTNGRIFRLDDPQNASPGTTPVNITPPGLAGNVQDIAVNPNDDNEILAVVSNYGTVNIWWTANAKSATPSWKNAEGNLTMPSIRSCAIITKKDAGNQAVTEYYVGTSIGMYSVANLASVFGAGAAPVWQREGGDVLNYAVVVSLAYRPADNVLLVGTHGNGLYYTNLGTPNFIPDAGLGVNPITNDKHFIRVVYPNPVSSEIGYRAGDLFGVKKVHIDLADASGRTVLRADAAYADGKLQVRGLSPGMYILTILSDDRKYRHIEKLVKR